MNKDERQRIIIKIINNNEVHNQNELIKLLKNAGCPIAQATISRDIKELRIVKELDKKGAMRYVVNDFVNFATYDEKTYDFFSKMIISIGVVKNIVLLHCKNATAQAVCLMFDRLNYEGVAGTVAGYNTIIVVLDNDKRAVGLKRDIESRL